MVEITRALFGFTGAEWVMLGIVALTFLLRLNGLQAGLPELYCPDEWPIVQTAIAMLQRSVLSEWWTAPPPFVQLTFYAWVQWVGAVLTFLLNAQRDIFRSVAEIDTADYWRFLVVGRFISSLIGTATVWLVYLIGRKLTDTKTGILAALVLALVPLHMEYSRYIYPAVPATFLVLLSFWFSCWVMVRGVSRDYILAGLFGGLATATQLSNGIILLPLLAAHLMGTKNDASRPKGVILAGTATFGAGFLLGCPYLFLNLPFFLRELSQQAMQWHLSQGYNPDWIGHVVWMANAKLGIVTSLSFLVAILYAFYRRSKADIMLLSFVVPYSLLMGRSFDDSPPALLPILPFLCILVAQLVFHGPSGVKWKSFWFGRGYPVARIAATILLVAALGYYAGVASLTVVGQAPTQRLAKDWIVANIPPINSVAGEKDAPELSEYRRLDSSWVLGLDHPLDWYKANKYAVVVLADDKGMEFSSIEHPAIQEFRRTLVREEVLLKEFSPSLMEPGPRVLVYQVLPLVKRGDELVAEKFGDGSLNRWMVLDGEWIARDGTLHVVGATTAKNLLQNPGFEDVDEKDGGPKGWAVNNWGGSQQIQSIDTSEKHSGIRAIKIQKTNDVGVASYKQEKIPVIPGLEYQLMAHGKGEGGGILVNYYDSDGLYLEGMEAPLERSGGMAGWHEVGFSTKAPLVASEARIWLLSRKGGSIVWFDDVFFGTAEPKNIMLVEVSDEDASTWDNYVYEVRLSLNGVPGNASLLFRVKDTSNYYYLELDAGAQIVRLGKVQDGKPTELVARAVKIETNVSYSVKAWIRDNVLEGYVDDVLAIQGSDGTFATGKVGLKAGDGSRVTFQDLTVRYDPLQ